MNIQVPPSPASVTSNDWHGPPKYRQQTQSPVLGPNQGRRNLVTPPSSGSSFGVNVNGGPPPIPNGPPNMNGRPGDFGPPGPRGNPSPPSSVAGRSSNGSSLVPNDASQRRKQSMEDILGQHYFVLKRYLATVAQDELTDGKPNRARDKLVRLSPIQFQELSTDVYDELLRRQSVASRQNGSASPGNQAPPTHLLPVPNFHPKRNQARQKLSTLPPVRFRALATDVFYELERRVPRFAAGDIARVGSPANSIRGPPSRTGTPSGMRPGSQNQMRRPPPRQGSLGSQVFAGGYGPPSPVPGPDGFNGPTQKSSQSNTIVPNKSYLVEDDDDADGDSLYGLNKRDTTNTAKSFGAQEKFIAEYQNKVDDLQAKLEALEKQIQEKDNKIESLESSQQTYEKESTEVSILMHDCICIG
jgi:hypothetical protein